MIPDLKRNVKHMNRYRQIAQTMTKYGMGYVVDQIGLTKFLPKGKTYDEDGKLRKRSLAVTYRTVLEELGPTFIKLGQILSTRPDIISKEYVNEFSKLQDNVKALPFEQISQEMEKELNKPLNTVFRSIDEKELASASIGQVHKAVLLDGTEVAVKVQKPGIERVIDTDLEIMKNLAGSLGNMMANRSPYEPVEIVEEFAKAIKRELDYNIEANNAKRLYRDFKDSDNVKIPKVYDKYTTKRLIVMEYIDGVKVSDILNKDYPCEDRKNIANIGAEAILSMIFEHGFFHADPHPGNIFVMGKDKIAFLDFGIMGKISKRNRKALISMLVCIVNRNPDKIADIILDLTGSEVERKDEFIWDIEDLLDIYLGKELEEVDIGEFIENLTYIAKQYGIKMPSNLALLGKAIVMIEGIGRQLDPNFNATKVTRPYAQRMLKEQMRPSNLIKEWYENLSASGERILDLPDKVDKIVTNLSTGEIKLGVGKGTFDQMSIHFERSINRLSFSIVVAGMVMASSLMFMADIGPRIYDLPLLGLVGFLISFALGIGLIRGIMQSGRL
ncbi:MAG TPA: AarF/ABC1/UbiB kinase family protein [Candidatus Methanofastidiosa archaeon]|nr:AarF/ABC1/UbiB kinase family protein [Candidatus Methanofastidiosa archaeon]